MTFPATVDEVGRDWYRAVTYEPTDGLSICVGGSNSAKKETGSRHESDLLPTSANHMHMELSWKGGYPNNGWFTTEHLTKVWMITRGTHISGNIWCIQFLVGGLNPSEKYESQLGWLFPIYGKIKLMFQTTNQVCYSQFRSRMEDPPDPPDVWIHCPVACSPSRHSQDPPCLVEIELE